MVGGTRRMVREYPNVLNGAGKRATRIEVIRCGATGLAGSIRRNESIRLPAMEIPCVAQL